MVAARCKHPTVTQLLGVLVLGVLCFISGRLQGNSAHGSCKLPPPPPPPRLPQTDFAYPQRPLCDNEIRTIYGKEDLLAAVAQRFEFHDSAFMQLSAFMNRPRQNCSRPLPCWLVPQFSGMAAGWDRFDLMGPIAECPSLISFGKGDEEKKFCVVEERLTKDTNCIVFSIGGHNLWGFEHDLASRTKCHIHTFDCTVEGKIPEHLRSRVTFHKLCLGSASKSTKDREFGNLNQLVKAARVDHVTLLKMDIEGFEYEALTEIIDGTTDQSLLPTQIALEVHYVTGFDVFFKKRDVTPGEIYAFFNYVFSKGGYVLGARNDNIHCSFCTEILLVKAVC